MMRGPDGNIIQMVPGPDGVLVPMQMPGMVAPMAPMPQPQTAALAQ